MSSPTSFCPRGARLFLRWAAVLPCCITLIMPLAAAPLPVTTTIAAATVYPDRAVVTRQAQLTLPAGASELTLAGLPVALEDASLQVSGRGAGITLLDVTPRSVYLETTPDPRRLALETERETLQQEDRVLADQLAALDQQKNLLTRIENAVTQPAGKDSSSAAAVAPRPSIEDWQKLLTFSLDNNQRFARERRDLLLQRTTLERKITAAEARLQALPPTERRATKTATIRLTAAQAGPLELTVAYALPGASWTPAYDARLRSEERAVDLTYYGVVRNATGEDWPGIALTLSTARPSLGGAAPELSPWIVAVARPDFDQVVKMDKFSSTSRSIRALSATAVPFAAAASAPETSAEAPPPEAELALASVDTTATSATFRVASPVTLPSDNQPQKIGLTSARLVSSLQYFTAPRLRETAYLTAQLTNTTEFPLLAGEVNTFLDQTLIATSRLKTVMPTEKFNLAFGADEGVAVLRRLVNRFSEDTGFTTRQRRLTYEFVVTLTNHKRTLERVTVRDVLPVSRDEKIVVKLLAPTERDLLKPEDAAILPPRLGIAREPEGRLAWRVELKPGEKRELPLKFSIEHPLDLPVSGVE